MVEESLNVKVKPSTIGRLAVIALRNAVNQQEWTRP